MDRHDLDERIELFRENDPDVADSSPLLSQDPEASLRWKKIQTFDAVVGAAIRKVKVPAGLSEGILARIGVQAAERQRRSRRNYILGGISSALILSLLIGLSIFRWPDPSWTRSRLTEAAAVCYLHRSELPPATDETPPFPQVGLRGVIAGFQEKEFLKKDALVYRLETAAGDHAVAIIVPAAWFPADFDPSASYAVAGDVALEVRFIPFANDEQYCIFVSANPKAFEAKALIF